MKYFLFFISLFLAINTFSQGHTGSRKKSNTAATSANAPKTKQKASGSEVAMEELILYNKSGSSKQKRQTEAPTHPKTKLDDLKNPFDSTKKLKANQPATVQSSSHDRYANIETNIRQDNKQVQQSPAAQNAEKTKLDDLKNPFDSTKKVKPGVQSPKSPVKQKPYIGETEKN